VSNPQLELYAVRSQDGKWFRRKGYGGYGETWAEDFEKARIYNRIGPARGVVTWFAKRYPEYGVPNLVRLVITKAVLVDETERVEKRNKKEQEWLAKRDERQAKLLLKSAQKRLEEAQQKVDELSKKAKNHGSH
jgi:hypothetical protein